MGKWLEYIEDEYYIGKTKRWWVKHKETKEILASVKWHNGWRQYVVYPLSDTFWSSGCLEELFNFVNQEMKKWKQKKN